MTTSYLSAPASLRGLDPTRLAVVRAWRRLGLIVSGTVTSVQIGRKAATLNQLSDHQLADIGIARQEIYGHAEKLVLTPELVEATGTARH